MKKVIIFISVFVLLSSLAVCTFLLFFKINKNDTNTVIDSINNYSYKLEASATSLIKKEFTDLKKILETDEINEEEYAIAISRLFIADLYTLSNKLNKYDVGGIDYIFPDAVANYKLNVQNTLYKYLEDNSDDKRKQSLPEVKAIELSSSETNKFEIAETEYEGFKINLTWSYVEDMDYDTSAEVILVKKDKYFYIVEKN